MSTTEIREALHEVEQPSAHPSSTGSPSSERCVAGVGPG